MQMSTILESQLGVKLCRVLVSEELIDLKEISLFSKIMPISWARVNSQGSNIEVRLDSCSIQSNGNCNVSIAFRFVLTDLNWNPSARMKITYAYTLFIGIWSHRQNTKFKAV